MFAWPHADVPGVTVGHTVKRCKEPIKEEEDAGGDGGFGNGGFDTPAFTNNDAGEFDAGQPAGDWDGPPATVDPSVANEEW